MYFLFFIPRLVTVLYRYLFVSLNYAIKLADACILTRVLHFNHFPPTLSSLLFYCLMPDDFDRQWESLWKVGSERVKYAIIKQSLLFNLQLFYLLDLS